MQTKSKLIFGLIGVGNHALEVINSLSATHHACLNYLLTSSSEKSSFLQKRFADLKVFEHLSTLLACPDLDAVYICTPNHLHFIQAKQALLAGKHVICEKPLTIYSAEAKELIEIAKTKKLILIENFAYRFHPQHLKVKELLENNTIGKVTSIKADYHYELNDENNIRMKAESLGGAWSDVGCYLTDTVIYFFNHKIKSINSKKILHPDRNIDLETNVTLMLENNISAQLSASMQKPRNNSYVIKGTKGNIKVRNAYHVMPTQKVNVELQREDGEKEILNFTGYNQLANLIDTFCNKIRNPHLVTNCLTNGLENAILTEKIKKF